jgi:hypothetical protein
MVRREDKQMSNKTTKQVLNIETHPELASLALGQISLEYSRHAVLRAQEKNFSLARAVTVVAGMIVEIERENNKTTKLVVRLAHDKKNDLVLVLVPRAAGLFFVITAWLNRKDDNHATLRLDRLSA